ncbi:hypothetical protein BJ165DRAFT_1455720 [Panaeolus papilionaceus]|nr:hypothetical protein BJ165DRAFT_1455720 [Panaeolus papilionaceus]
MSMYNYLGTPNNNLICCICRAPFLDPLTSKLCSHTFCSSCILQALSHSSQCPIDRTPLTENDLERAPSIVRAMVDELEVECVYGPPRREEPTDIDSSKEKETVKTPIEDTSFQSGCKWTGERETLGAHLEVCEYAEGNRNKNHDASNGTRCSNDQAQIDGDGSQKMTNVPSGSASPTTSDPATHLSQLPLPTSQTTRGSCPHAAFGCPYVAQTGMELSPDIGGEDSSAMMQADIETHLTACPYESLKGFFSIFSSTVTSQKQAIDESKRREDTLHATIQELKENEKRAKLVLEQNILLKRRLESLEAVASNFKKELSSIRTALGPWATVASSSQNTSNSSTATPLDIGTEASGMRFTPATGSTSGVYAFSLPSTAITPTTSFASAPSGSDRAPERTSPVTHPTQNAGAGWGNGPSDMSPINATSPFVNFSPRVDDTISGISGMSSDSFASFFPNQGDEYSSGTSLHGQHRRATSSVSLPLMMPPLDTTSSLEGTLQRLNASITSIAAAVEGLTVQVEGVSRRGEIGLANEAVRVGEEIGSLRAQIYGLRMLVHGLMVERGMGTRWPGANPSGGPAMNMGDSDDEQRNHAGPPLGQTVPLGMPPPSPPFFLRNAGIGMGMGAIGGPSITKL